MEPNKVYRNKKKEARIFRSLEPQIPIKKNIGIKILSKKIKKATKSTAVKERIINSSKKSKDKQYSWTRTNPNLYEVNKHKGVINVLNKTKNKEIPSIPNDMTNWCTYKNTSLSSGKFELIEVIYSSFNTNWYWLEDRSNKIQKKEK